MIYDSKERLRLTGRDTYFRFHSARRAWRDKGKTRHIVLCNSFPKSGTHMLSQILEGAGAKKWNDIVSVQSLSGVMNTREHIAWKVGSAPNGTMVRSHLMYDPEILKILGDNGAIRFFIYRDLRDVAVSHARWVLNEPRIFLHDIYTAFDDFDRCLMTSIKGLPLGTPTFSNCSQPDIGTDFSRWRGWLDDASTISIKFEELVGARGQGDEATRMMHVKRILEKLGVTPVNADTLALFGSETMNPETSHTFRKGNKGAIGSWKKFFNDGHKEAFKTVAGQTLIDLGYEQDMSW